jgi:glycosyltransferase involved in cell wall biosynthesis
VLFITGEYPPLPGGVGDYTARLAAALEALGARVSVLARHGAAGERVRTVARWGWRTPYRAALDAAGAKIAHIQYQAGAFDMHPAINLLPRRLSVPTVTTVHDLLPPYLFPKAGRLRGALLRDMAAHSAAVIVTNAADERALARRGVRAARIPIGPNLPPPILPAQVGNSVAFFGFPARSKGIEALIAALGALPASCRPPLTLIGPDGAPDAANDHLSRAEVDRLAADAHVTLIRTGYLTPQAASDALAAARVIALPFADGASLRSGSLLAALQVGRPVVTTAPVDLDDLGALAALPQLRLAPRGDRAALAGVLRAALAAAPCNAPLPNEFNWDAIARRHLALYAALRRGAR